LTRRGTLIPRLKEKTMLGKKGGGPEMSLLKSNENTRRKKKKPHGGKGRRNFLLPSSLLSY